MNIRDEIQRIVKEYNEAGEPIYLEKLVPLLPNPRAKSTAHKHTKSLVEDGELIDETVTVKGVIYKYLYHREFIEKTKNKDRTSPESVEKTDDNVQTHTEFKEVRINDKSCGVEIKIDVHIIIH